MPQVPKLMDANSLGFCVFGEAKGSGFPAGIHEGAENLTLNSSVENVSALHVLNDIHQQLSHFLQPLCKLVRFEHRAPINLGQNSVNTSTQSQICLD